MVKYQSSTAVESILRAAYAHVVAAPYTVTARWVFYRLLQDGILQEKSDYKRLLGYLSKARKGFFGGWRPDTLSDDTRQPIIRGTGFVDGAEWLQAVARMSCNLDHWEGQACYVEIWFEAAAMTAQFEYYTNSNVTLLAFHGDISIPAKWEAATRIASRCRELSARPIIFYYGDLDSKGLQIPESARVDVQAFLVHLGFYEELEWVRVGLNEEHVVHYAIPENPERPGTYQWEALNNVGAQELILVSEDVLDHHSFDQVGVREDVITTRFREHLDSLDLEERGAE